MKNVDVVVGAWNKEREWPFVVRGLLANRERINRVILTFDGPVQFEPKVEGLEIVTTGYERNGHRKALAMDIGIRMAEVEKVLAIDGDVVIPPDAIDQMDGYGGRFSLISPMMANVPKIKNLVWPSEYWWLIPPELEPDMRVGYWNVGVPCHRIRGGCMYFYRKSYEEMGGYDTGIVGYGFEDYIFANNWLLAYGVGSLVACDAVRGWHISRKPVEKGEPATLILPHSHELLEQSNNEVARHLISQRRDEGDGK